MFCQKKIVNCDVVKSNTAENSGQESDFTINGANNTYYVEESDGFWTILL